MAPPRGRGGGRGRGRGGRRRGGSGESRGRGGAGSGFSSKARGRVSRGPRPESDAGNEDIYNKQDRFHMEKDKIALEGNDSDSEDSDGSDEEEAVMDMDGVNDSGSSGDEDDDSDVSDLSDLPELPEHVRRAAMEASSDDDDGSEDEDAGQPKFAAGWGKKRSAYYNADTADLEIGQEFEDAEAEEEAALELQRASYKRLDPADFGEEEEEEKGVIASAEASKSKRQLGKSSGAAGTVETGAALLSMKTDLEQIALGAGGEVETAVVKRDTSKLSRRDKLELVLSEAPELPALLGEVRGQMDALVSTVQPLISNVTGDLGASEDGLEYLRTRQQLLLAYCMNVCFYMMLKARGEPAKGHPVVRRLLSLRELVGDMSTLDKRMGSQVDLLLRALAAGVDLVSAGADGSAADSSDASGDDGDAEDMRHQKGIAVVGSAKKECEELDEEGLAEEEARFMGCPSTDDISSDDPDMMPSVKMMKDRKKAGREGALAKARARAALDQDHGDAALGDFGDEEVDGEQPAGLTTGVGGNLLQGMVNRISQREQATSGKKKALQGDLDVPFRERDQTIRVRRPVPGESDSESDGGESVANVANSSDADSGEGDLGFGGGGFMGGLPPGLLEQLSQGGSGDGGKKKSKKQKRLRESNSGRVAEGEDEGNEFYQAIAQEKKRKQLAKKEKYHPESRIAGALEAELEAERAARGKVDGGDKRGASYSIIKNRGLTPHKNKLNRNPRAKKREAFRKATIRRKGQVRDIRTNEADAYGGEQTGIRANVTRSRHLKG